LGSGLEQQPNQREQAMNTDAREQPSVVETGEKTETLKMKSAPRIPG